MYRTKKEFAGYMKALGDEYYDGYQRIVKESVKDYISRLQPGAKIPENRIYGKAFEDQMFARATSVRNKAAEAIADYRKQIQAKMSYAPSEEALRAVQMFAFRDPKKSTKEAFEADVEALVSKHGDNYMAYQAIKDKASEREIYLDEHPLAGEIEALDHLSRSVERTFSAYNAVSQGLDHLPISIYKMAIDHDFGENE